MASAGQERYRVHLIEVADVTTPQEYEGTLEEVQEFTEAWMHDHIGQAVVIVPEPIAA